jgi:beta-glucanase (GH16 family)
MYLARGLTISKPYRARTIKALALSLAVSAVWFAIPPAANAHGTKAAAGSSRISNVGKTKTIFYDNFDGATLSTAWERVSGTNANSSNEELQCYSDKSVFVRNGSLVERATAGTTRGCDCPSGSGKLCRYLSGAVQWRRLGFTYGTVSIRAKLAAGVGTWPAIWLLGTQCRSPQWIVNSCDWPAPGSNEIDIAEVIPTNPYLDRYAVNEQIHTLSLTGATVDPSCDAIANSTTWHTYTLIWSRRSLVWKIDGNTTCRVTDAVPSTPMFLIINTAVGRRGDIVISQTLPQTTQISYVRVTKP